MADDKLFRLFDKRDKIWVWEDKSIIDADFPEYLKMIQIQGAEFFKLDQWIGEQDINGTNIYENDIIKYKDNNYLVTREGFEFLPVCLNGEGEDCDIDEVEVIGNALENAEMIQ